MKKEKSDQNAVAELTREGLYKENKWLWEENKKLNEEIENHKQNIMEDELEIIPKLEEENKKLKEKLSEITMVADDEKQSIEHILELEEENKKLKEYNGELIENHKKDVAILCEENKKLREELSAYDREYFDEDKKAKNIFMEEDTLQELKDIGEL